MHVRCAPSEEVKHFRFMPPDPAWAPVAELERCRSRLRDHDGYLALWWSAIRGIHAAPPVGRWRIMEWLKTSETWSHVGYWETSEGLYRAPNASEMLAWVQSMDEWAKGSDLEQVSRRIDAANEQRAEKAKRVKHDETMRESVEMADRTDGKGGDRLKGAHRFDAPKMSVGGIVLP